MTGQIVAFKLPLKGKLDGKKLKVGYDEGQIHVDATLELEPSGNAFKGTFQASNGNRGVWNGWRPDPAAAKGEPADFSGLWLTDLGLMELTQEGSKVKGQYALRGTSSLEGEVKGRHLEFQIKAFRTGPGWFDLDEKGTSLAGAGGTDGMPGWYGWKGRKAPEFVRHVPLAAGKIVQGSTSNLLTYSDPRSGRLQAGRRQEMAGRGYPPRLEHECERLREHAGGRLARHRARIHHPGHQRRDLLEPGEPIGRPSIIPTSTTWAGARSAASPAPIAKAPPWCARRSTS